MNEDRARELLRDRPAPDEAAAEERAWRVVKAGLAEQEPVRRVRRPRRFAVAATALLALLAAGLTPPGQAVAEWLRDAVRPGRDDARQALSSLPADGRLLVTSARGPWIVERNGSKRLLGAYEDASWSPQGLFVVVTRGHEVIALEPGGRPRWSVARAGRVRAARWSPDGFRIAYHAGGDLRVVAGDGTGDALLARGTGPAPSAWWPGNAHRLAYVDAGDSRVVVRDTDSGRVVWRSAPGGPVSELAWSSDGRRLLAVGPQLVRQFDARGRLMGSLPLPSGNRAQTAAFHPGRDEFALVSHDRAADRSRLEVVRLRSSGARSQVLLAGAGAFGDVEWSPDGRWLLVAWRAADQWVFVRTGDRSQPAERLRTVGNIASQFDPGAGEARFPRLAGWCCPPVGRPK